MPIEFNCLSCSKLLRVPDGSGGKQCQCPGCSALLNIPLQHVDVPAQSPVDSDGGNSDGGNSDGGTDIALCIPCPKCKHELICDPSLVGTKGQCRSCKHIFVISDLPTNETQGSLQTINWVFSCPKCNQLFEGSEAMRGRRGKCHACGDVFPIDLRVADDASVESPVEKQMKENKVPKVSHSSFDDDLTFEILPDEPKATREQTSRAVNPANSTGTEVYRASRGEVPPIQFNCTGCKGRLEVPGAAAQQLTHCPHCKRQLTVPSASEPTAEALAASDPWADLSPLGSAPAQMPQSNPFGDTFYPPPMPMSSMSAPMSGARRRSGGKSGQFITCGVFVAICAGIGIAIEMFYIVVGTVAMMVPNVDHTVASIYIFVPSVMFVLSLLQLVGGISLARRSGHNMARTGAIICCLPCICLILNIPFGIWGCILVFGRDAEREFR